MAPRVKYRNRMRLQTSATVPSTTEGPYRLAAGEAERCAALKNLRATRASGVWSVVKYLNEGVCAVCGVQVITTTITNKTKN